MSKHHSEPVAFALDVMIDVAQGFLEETFGVGEFGALAIVAIVIGLCLWADHHRKMSSAELSTLV